jgi:hypothetical protein
VLREAPQHRVEVAGALAGDETRGEDRRVELPFLAEGVRERDPRLHLLPHRCERLAQQGVPLPLEHDVERLEERQPRLQQRGELLREHQQQARVHALLPHAQRVEREPAPQRKEIKTLLLELGAQRPFVRRLEPALDYLTRRRADPADVLHSGLPSL